MKSIRYFVSKAAVASFWALFGKFGLLSLPPSVHTAGWGRGNGS